MGDALHHLLAPERNSEALFNILRVLIENSESWSHIVQKWREQVAPEYHLSVQGQRMADHYSKIRLAT
jgi:hypothetical protein